MDKSNGGGEIGAFLTLKKERESTINNELYNMCLLLPCTLYQSCVENTVGVCHSHLTNEKTEFGGIK